MADTHVHTLLVEELALLWNQKHVTHELAHCKSKSHGPIYLLAHHHSAQKKKRKERKKNLSPAWAMINDWVRNNKSYTGTKKGIADEISEKKGHYSIIHSCLVLYMPLQWYNKKGI